MKEVGVQKISRNFCTWFSVGFCCIWKKMIEYLVSSSDDNMNSIQRVHEKTPPPKYNGVVFEILGKHQ